MNVYRADPHDAERFRRLLTGSGLIVEVTRYGPTGPTYLSIDSNRPDIPTIAKAAGASVRRVHTLAELEVTPDLSDLR